MSAASTPGSSESNPRTQSASRRLSAAAATAAGSASAATDGGVQLTGEAVQHGERGRGLEIVGHRRVERGGRVTADDGDAVVGSAASGAGVPPGVTQRLAEARRDRGSLIERALVVVDRHPVVGAGEEREEGLAPEPIERIPQSLDVAGRLRHLLVRQPQHPVVQPVAREVPRAVPPRDCARSFSWCGKIEIDAAAVEVEALAEVRSRHRRALDVPAGPPRPHGDGHDGSPGLAAFHSAKSSGAPSCSSDLDARARFELDRAAAPRARRSRRNAVTRK